jgi:hypothetical protein
MDSSISRQDQTEERKRNGGQYWRTIERK